MVFCKRLIVSFLVSLSLVVTLVIVLIAFNVSIALVVRPILSNIIPNITIKDANLGWDRAGKSVVIILEDIEYTDSEENFQIRLSKLGVNVSLLNSIANRRIVFDLLSFYEITIFLEEYENGEIVFKFPEYITYYQPADISSNIKDFEVLQDKISGDAIVNDNYVAKIKKLNKEINKNNANQKSFLENLDILNNTKRIIISDSTVEFKTYKNVNEKHILNFKTVNFTRLGDEVAISALLKVPLKEENIVVDIEATIDYEDKLSFNAKVKNIVIQNIENYFYLMPKDILPSNIKDKIVANNILAQFNVVGEYDIKNASFIQATANLNIQNGRFNYDNFFKDDILISSIETILNFSGKENVLSVEKLNISLEKGIPINIPAIKGNWDARNIALKATVNFSNYVKLQDINIKTKNNLVTGNFSYFFNNKSQLDFDLNVNQIRFNDVLKYWPDINLEDLQLYLNSSVVNNPVVENFAMKFSYDLKRDNATYSGQGAIKNVSYNYLDTMPNIKASIVNLNFNNNIVEVNYNKGNVKGIAIDKGSVKVYGKSSKTEFDTVAINNSINADIKTLLAVLYNSNVFGAENTIDKNRFEGQISGALQAEYSITNEELTSLSSEAKISGLEFKNVFANKSFKANLLDFRINDNVARVSGRGVFDEILPISLNAYMNLNEDKAEKAVYSIEANTSLDIMRNYKEFDSFSRYLIYNIKGKTKLFVKYIDYKNTNKDKINVLLNFSANEIDYKGLYSKNNLKALKSSFNLEIEDNDIKAVQDFKILGNDIKADLNIGFNDKEVNFAVKNFYLKDFYSGSANILLQHKNVNIDVNGKFLNISKIKSIRDIFTTKDTKSNKTQTVSHEGEGSLIDKSINKNSTSYSLLLKIEKLYYKKRLDHIKNLNIKYYYTNSQMVDFTATGFLGEANEGNKFSIALYKGFTRAKGGQRIDINIPNTGHFSSALGFYNKVLYGDIKDSIFVKQEQDGFSISGNTAVNSFVLNGVPFASSLIDFYYKNNILDIKSISLKGSLLNIEAIGNINTKEQTISLKGHLAPVANISNLFNAIPLIRSLPIQDGLIKIPMSLKGSLQDPKFSFSNK